MKDTPKQFSIASIPEWIARLSPTQRQLIDHLWASYVQKGRSFPYRALPLVVGKGPIDDVFAGLNGSILIETQEDGERRISLLFYGALLTGHGPILATLLFRLVDLVKELYQEDVYIKEVDRSGVQERLHLSDAEVGVLFRLLQSGLPPHMPFHLASWSQDGSKWSLAINDEVMKLYQSDDTLDYLNGLIVGGYDPMRPWSMTERLQQTLKGMDQLSNVLAPDSQNSASEAEVLMETAAASATKSPYVYDVAISFAGPERKYAEEVASIVREAGFKVFFDDFYPDLLWGKNLAELFDRIYRKESRYCLMFISKEYRDRIWTVHERRSATARALKERTGEYILPVRVEEVDIDGMAPTIGYLPLSDFPPSRIADLLIRKLQAV